MFYNQELTPVLQFSTNLATPPSVDGAKALSKAIRNTFGVAAAIQRCQVHKGRNIIERLPQHLHASVKKALRQAWDQDDANKAERFLRNLVRRPGA